MTWWERHGWWIVATALWLWAELLLAQELLELMQPGSTEP